MFDPPRRRSRLIGLGLVLAVLSAAGLLLAPLGYRLGWLELRFAFTLLRWSAYGGLAAGGVLLLGAIIARRWVPLLVGAGVAAIVLAIPWQWMRTALPCHPFTTSRPTPSSRQSSWPCGR